MYTLFLPLSRTKCMLATLSPVTFTHTHTPTEHQAIGEAMHRHMKLKELHLHNNKLGYEGVEKLAHELAKPLR